MEETLDMINGNTYHHTSATNSSQIDENGYLKDLYLKKDTEVVHTWTTPGGNQAKTIYRIVRHINSGGFANTYLVKKEGDDKLYVLKELCSCDARRNQNLSLEMKYDNDILNKFIKEPERVYKLLKIGKGRATCVTDDMSYEEAKRASRNEVGLGGVFEWHGNIYSNYDEDEKEQLNLVMPITPHFKWCENHYYVMQYVTGISLYHFMNIIEKHGKKDLLMILQIIEQLAIAVCNLHDINCIHQDLSANNILVDLDKNNKIKLKIIDFGLATDLDRLYSENDNSGTVLLPGGTPGFSDFAFSYYQIYPKNEKQLDIYSLGANLYFMTFCHDYSNFNGNDMQAEISKMSVNKNSILSKAKGKVKIDSHYPNLLNDIYDLILKSTICNQNGFKDRFQSAADFLLRVRAIMNPISSNSTHTTVLKTGAILVSYLLGKHFLGDDDNMSEDISFISDSDDDNESFTELLADMDDFGDNYNLFNGPSINISKEDLDDLDLNI